MYVSAKGNAWGYLSFVDAVESAVVSAEDRGQWMLPCSACVVYAVG